MRCREDVHFCNERTPALVANAFAVVVSKAREPRILPDAGFYAAHYPIPVTEAAVFVIYLNRCVGASAIERARDEEKERGKNREESHRVWHLN